MTGNPTSPTQTVILWQKSPYLQGEQPAYGRNIDAADTRGSLLAENAAFLMQTAGLRPKHRACYSFLLLAGRFRRKRVQVQQVGVDIAGQHPRRSNGRGGQKDAQHPTQRSADQNPQNHN